MVIIDLMNSDSDEILVGIEKNMVIVEVDEKIAKPKKDRVLRKQVINIHGQITEIEG